MTTVNCVLLLLMMMLVLMLLLYCALCYVVCRPIMIIICVIAFGICVLSFSLFWFIVASLSESLSLSNFRWRICSLWLARLLSLSFSFYRLPCWWPYTIGLVWCTQTLEFTQIYPKEISRTNSIYSFEKFLLFVWTNDKKKTLKRQEKNTLKNAVRLISSGNCSYHALVEIHWTK